MQWIGYIGVRLVSVLFFLIPFSALYKVSNGVAWLLYKGLGYRREVIKSNLQKCFPDYPEDKIDQMVWEAYLNLSDIVVEVAKSLSMPIEKVKERYVCLNPEVVNEAIQSGKSVILSGYHYNNWEWGVQTLGMSILPPFYGINKGMSNKLIDKYINKIRVRGNMILVETKEFVSFLKENHDKPGTYVLLGDQNPSNHKRMHWVDFFGIDTACPSGIDYLARKYDFPVYHFDVRRVKRGRYEITFLPLCLEPRETKEGEITEMVMKHLEEMITEYPPSWLWSHKRWKLSREV
ncbi:MAG: hypothetical protein R2879_11375 [Saprospiraceae bacterium]